MGVIINSAVVPIVLSMCWERLTGIGMITGSLCGSLLALVSWISVTATYPGGLSNFRVNATREAPSLTGNVVSLLSGGLISVLVSMLTGQSREGPDVWEKTRDIDNPLSPWTELYEKDLCLTGAYRLDNRPSLADVQSAFRGTKYLALIGSVTLTVVLIILWPLIMVAVSVMSFDSFFHWVTLSKVWAFIATIFIITAPLMNEIWDIYKAYRQNHLHKVAPCPTQTDDKGTSDMAYVNHGHNDIKTNGEVHVADNDVTYSRPMSVETVTQDAVHLSAVSQLHGPDDKHVAAHKFKLSNRKRTRSTDKLNSAGSVFP